jgi:hypothetical protein
MVNRVKMEAAGDSEEAVQSKLLAAWEAVKEHTGGEWEIEREMSRTDEKGSWGMLIVKRKENDGH